MEPKFRIAAITDEFSPADPARALTQMASIGMTGAELRVIYGKNIMDLNDGEMASLRDLLQAHKMEVISIASPILKCVLPTAPDIDTRFQQDIFNSKHTFEDQPELAERAFRIARFFGYDDSITFAACFDANGAVFEPLFGADDAIISDSLNHASIIDGVRLSKARRYRFANNDMADLEAQLQLADQEGSGAKVIVTDGVFSMDGFIANLSAICDLADKYGALVMVDDCHAAGFMGETGRGSIEHCGVMGRVDLLTGTLGKALGGGMGGYICARQPVIDLLRQRARPYLFSNALAPGLVGASLKVFDMLEAGNPFRAQLFANAARFRAGMSAAGFTLQPGEHPIIPVMLGDARLASDMAARLLDEGIYVTGFSFPVVPRGAARIRTQMSAAHTFEHIDRAIAAFTKVGRELGVI